MANIGTEGLSLDPGTGLSNVLAGIETGLKGFQEGQQKKRDLDMQKMKYFFTLRDAGYSEDQAGNMVSNQYGTFETPPATSGLSDTQIERMTDMETLKEKKAKRERGYDVKETETIAEKSAREMGEFKEKETFKIGLEGEKKPSYIDNFRTDSRNAANAIKRGATAKAVLKRLVQKYPDKAKQIEEMEYYLGE